MQQISPEKQQKQESFYSIDQSRTSFTFIEEPKLQPSNFDSNKLMNLYGMKQSSALQMADFSQNELNKSMYSIKGGEQQQIEVLSHMNVNDISRINHNEMNQLQCSVCLQKQIDCLSLPNEPTQEQVKQLKQKMNRLKSDQSILKKQIQVFQGFMAITKTTNQNLAKTVLQTNTFMRKKCEHFQQNNPPFNVSMPYDNQYNIKTLRESNINNSTKPILKHYDIKPSRNRSASEEKLNSIYKQASFGHHITLIDDSQNEYKLQAKYHKQSITFDVINYSKGQTNFVYAIKINQENSSEQSQKISEKLIFPMIKYTPKKFTISLNILLLIFEEKQPKEQKYLIKIEQIRTISAPLPLCYFIQPRFLHFSEKQKLVMKLMNKLCIYEIDINYKADIETYNRLKQLDWVKNEWISLKGSFKLIRVQLCSISDKQNEKTAIFRISTKQKDTQEAIDVIQYLCFMLSI